MRRPRPRVILGICTLGGVALLTAVAGLHWVRTSRQQRPNLLLITIDTLRADRVGAYGSRTVSTPALDRLAREGVRFAAAYASVPLTLPSHVSMLSGRLPVGHGVHANDATQVPATLPLVQARLRAAGYATAAFVSAAVLGRTTGIDRGFDEFDDQVDSTGDRRGGDVAERASAWLRVQREKPFFLWVHLYDPHRPYAAPEPYGTRYASRPYDGEVAYADACVQLLLDTLQRQGLLSRTAVVLAGDHGEALGEHGEGTHGALLYESALRVPVILRLPDAREAGRVVDASVSLVQVAPTLLELASLRDDDGPEALWSRTRGLGNGAPVPVIAETLYLKLLLGWSALYAVRVDRYKLIDGPRPELYDIQADPGEVTDLAAARPETAKKLREVLYAELSRAARRAVAPAAGTATVERLQALAALGYVGSGAAPAPGVVPVAGADPKARISLWEKIEEGLDRSHRGDQASAASIFESVLREDPDNVLALKFLGARALQTGQLARAVELNTRVAATGLHRPDALSNLALAYERLGRRREALTAAAAALTEAPEHVAARFNRALVRSESGDATGALRDLDEVLRREPRHEAAQGLRNELLQGASSTPQVRAERAAARGDLPAALRELDSALERNPDDAALHELRGVLLARSGDRQRAIGALERALALGSRGPETLERIGALLHETGQRKAAQARFQQALAIDPARPGPRLSLAILDLENGRPQEALERLQGITQGWSGAAQAQFYLAEAKRSLGDREGAAKAYQACLEGARPGDPIGDEARSRLASLR